MKIKPIFFSLLMIFASVSLFAQESESQNSISYSNVTEFGVIAASPKSVFFEATTAHGFALNKQHHFGFGVGIGGNFHSDYRTGVEAHMPLFLNYRFYFKPDKRFSPHVNVALGGAILKDGGGLYSSVTMGFRAGKFSFSSGLSFLAIQRDEAWYDYEDPYGYGYNNATWRKESNWYFPIGITLKWGFAF
ncbi:MAG: hypothetical protein FWC10_01400 [Lentimicrobiaceae bacterium]|nr:hypothetical protein [Lentimicrobiaceae bacterium]